MRDRFAGLPVRVRRFRTCPDCSFDWATGEGVRACSYYTCPYLPAELALTCDFCGFNFASGDGQERCDRRTCQRAVTLRHNVRTHRLWRDWIELVDEQV